VPVGELRGLAQAQIDKAKATLEAVMTQGSRVLPASMRELTCARG
jgi:hypothetical protein